MNTILNAWCSASVFDSFRHLATRSSAPEEFCPSRITIGAETAIRASNSAPRATFNSHACFIKLKNSGQAAFLRSIEALTSTRALQVGPCCSFVSAKNVWF